MTVLSIVGILVIAASATLADFIWYTNGVGHTVVAGVTYGALVLMSVGAVLGVVNGRIARGLPVGVVAGVGGALSYYLLILTVDSRIYGSAIPAAWVIMWLMLAALEGRWLRAPEPRSWRAIAARGALAALLGGIVFASVRHLLWGRPASADRNYLLQFVTWAVAWAPGILSLTWTVSRRPGSIAPSDLAARLAAGERPPILDVRSEAEYAAGHLPGSVNVPFTQVSSRRDAIPAQFDTPLIIYCGHGPRASMAAVALRRLGWRRLVYLSGHFAAWQRQRLPVER